jgi:hypothetical protein
LTRPALQIPGLEEKREPAVCHVCLRKPLLPGDGRAKTAGSMTGAFAPFLWDNLKKTGQKPALGRRNWLNSGLLLRPLPSCLLIWAFFRGSLVFDMVPSEFRREEHQFRCLIHRFGIEPKDHKDHSLDGKTGSLLECYFALGMFLGVTLLPGLFCPFLQKPVAPPTFLV